MAAYKIIYGAGPTLTREESRFGRGYGFVGMHRHQAVKELAFGTLESHLHGKNIYELEKRWMGVFSAGPEIAAFHRIGDWSVLIRISAKQTEGRLWSFEEILLIDAEGVEALSKRHITPAEVLLWSGPGPGSDGSPLWHRDSLWAEPATWYRDPLPLETLPWDQAIPVGPDPGLAPFRFPACDWAVAREGTEEERTLLPAYARAQRNLLQQISQTPGGISPDEFQEIFWERLTFTTFDLDPSRVLDLSFGTGEPHAWDGLWEGIHDSGRLESPEALAWPPRLEEEGGGGSLAVSRREIEQAGWLVPLTVETSTPAPSATSFDEPASAVHTDRRPGHIDKSRFKVASPRQKRKQSWNFKIWGMVVVIAVIVLVPTLSLINSSREKARIDAMVGNLWDGLLIQDGDGNSTFNLSVEIPDELPTERRKSFDNILQARKKLNDYFVSVKAVVAYSSPLPSYEPPVGYESFKSQDRLEISQQFIEYFKNASEHINSYIPLQNWKNAKNEAKLPSEILSDLKSWMSTWQAKADARKKAQTGYEKLGLTEVAQGADENVIKRARLWLTKSAEKGDAGIIAALEELSRQTGAKEMFPELPNLLAKAPKQDSKSGDSSTLVKSSMPESSTIGSVVSPPSEGAGKTDVATDRIQSEFELIVEKANIDGYFNLPDGHFNRSKVKEVVCKAIALPLSTSRLWDGQLWISLDSLNNAFKGALEFKISGKSVRMGSEKVGELSNDGKQFKPDSAQNFFAILEGNKLRLLSVDSNSYEVPLSNQDFIASKTPEGFVLLGIPNGMIQVQIAKEGETQPQRIELPLLSKTTFDSAVEKAFAPGGVSGQLSGNILVGAQAFKTMLWETDLIQEGGLLRSVQGLKSFDIVKDNKVVGPGNKPCQLGEAEKGAPAGRQPIDTFLLSVKNFQTFLGSNYHSENEYTNNKLDRVLHGYIVELAKSLSSSSSQLPGEAPNRYFPWDGKETFLNKLVKTQSLANVLGEFQVLEQGKAKEFGAMDYSGMSFQEQNHQKLNNNLRPLAKSLPDIVAFVKWADELPAKDMPASRFKQDGWGLKSRFNWALEVAGANNHHPTTGDSSPTKADFSDPKKWSFKLVFHP